MTESPEGPSDRVLVNAVVHSQSEGAFRELYQRHTPRLLRVAHRMLDDEDDADDVVQETWLRTSTRLDRFRWESSLSSWLVGILINVAREKLSRRGKPIIVELEEELAAAPPPSESMDIERAVRALPPGSRAVFLLHDVEGFTHEEIAEQLGCTAGTSKTQLHRARRALRARLGMINTVEDRC